MKMLFQRVLRLSGRKQKYNLRARQVNPLVTPSFSNKEKETLQKQTILNQFSNGFSWYFAHSFAASFISFALFTSIFH